MALHTHTRGVGAHVGGCVRARVCVRVCVWVVRASQLRRLFLTIARWAKSLNQTNEMKFHAAKKIHIFDGSPPSFVSVRLHSEISRARVGGRTQICAFVSILGKTRLQVEVKLKGELKNI